MQKKEKFAFLNSMPRESCRSLIFINLFKIE